MIDQTTIARRDWKRFFGLPLLGVPALLGALWLLASTSSGIGIYPDSVMYIMMARSLLQGRGWTLEGVPVEIFPPLYPSLLALAGFGGDPVEGARWLQAAIWGVNIFWVGLITYGFSGKSVSAALFASLLALGAVDLFAYHTVALSDGAFLMFLLPSLLALDRYLEGRGVRYLVGSALLAALAAVTRYAGIAVIAAGIISILILERKRWSRRFLPAMTFGLMSFAPQGLWMLRNMQYQHPMGRRFDLHGFLGEPELNGFFHAASAWFFQWKIEDAWWMSLLPFILLGILPVWNRKRNPNRPVEQPLRARLLVIYMALYAILLILSAAFFQADLFRDSSRLLMPLHILFIVLMVTSGYEWLTRTGSVPVRIGAFAVCCAIALLVLTTGVQYSGKISGDGQGYASRAYRTSALIERTRSIPADITVYTNLELPIVLYTGRIPYMIPLKINNSTQRPNEQYGAEMKSMAADIRDSSALLVYFKRTPGWYVLPTLEEIRQSVPLRSVAELSDGGLYEAIPDTTGDR